MEIFIDIAVPVLTFIVGLCAGYVLGEYKGFTRAITEMTEDDVWFDYDEEDFSFPEDEDDFIFPFVVGDNVVVLDSGGIDSLPVGTIATVTKVNEDGRILAINGMGQYAYDNSWYEITDQKPTVKKEPKKKANKKVAKKKVASKKSKQYE
jgi:hypothetical protein